MEKKVVALCSFAVLGMLFYLVSFLVIVTRRHPWLVAKKLRLGALLLSFGGFASGCIQNPQVMCYDPVPPNSLSVEQFNGTTDEVLISKLSNDTLQGTLTFRVGEKFSYSVSDINDAVLLQENLSAVDGSLDEDTEEFQIPVGQLLATGMYHLKFYSVSKDSIGESYAIAEFKLNIVE